MLDIAVSYVISRKTNEPNLRKWKKIDSGPILAHLPQIRVAKIFNKDLASSVTRYHGQLSLCMSEKTNDPISRKLSDGRTDRETDVSDFIRRIQHGQCQKKTPNI